MKIEHIGIVVDKIETALEYYNLNFGYISEGQIYTDKNQDVKIAFMSAPFNNLRIELISPISDESPISNFLAKGGGLNHICYEVLDIRKAISTFVSNGSKLISGPTPAVAFQGHEIAFLFTRGREIIELVEA